MVDAALVVRPVINKVVDIGANLIVGESSRFYWLREDIRWLEREMTHMQAYLENAEAKKVTNPSVVSLIKDIRDLVHDVEDILDIYLPQIESHRSNGFLKRMTCFMPYCWTSSMFSREIQKIKRRVKDIDEARNRYKVEGTDDVSNVDPRTTKLHVDDPIIVGFEQHIKKLKSKLDKHPFVSIVGMPGLGKTTLAKKVFNVVFLDDIWNIEAWNSLQGCFPIVSGSASRIITTSRNSGVGRYIGGENSVHELHPFDPSTSWELFFKLTMSTNENFDQHRELVMIGEQIVKKCGGVPLAIALIVGMLREREMNESSWNRVLHRMGENAGDKCSQILGLSYRDLPTYLKPCFLYFGNFSEDYEFGAHEAIVFWMAEKFIPCVRGGSEPEDVGADYISELDARNLIQVVTRGHDGRVKTFRIHDLLYSFCVDTGREIDFLNATAHLESSSVKRVRRITMHHHRFVAESEKLIYHMTKLRALFYVKFDKETQIKHLNNMLGRFKLLQVLILEICLRKFDEYLYIPIGSLSRLNYLNVGAARCKVEIPRSIRNLKNLQTMHFLRCFKVKLPFEIWKMEQLRHLFLFDYEFKGVNQHQQVQILLPNLQTLVGIKCPDLEPHWLLELTNSRKLKLLYVTPEIMEVLCGPKPISEKLETLHFWAICSCILTRSMNLVKYERLMTLKIDGVHLQMQQPLELPPSLIKLTLEGTYLIEDPMKILKNLPNLKILSLRSNSYIGSEMDCSGADSFPRLEILELYALKKLEKIIEGKEMGMRKLKQFAEKDCDMLVQIPERLHNLVDRQILKINAKRLGYRRTYQSLLKFKAVTSYS